MVTTARKQEPHVPHLTHWIELASALIGHGLGEVEFSGMSLVDWHAVLCANESRFIRKKFAIAAIQGIAAQHLRDVIGAAACQLTIRLRFDESESDQS
jgi:hypothetical protein